MTSITWADKLVGHLTSDDFFGVANYPAAKFVITNVVSRGKEGDYKIVVGIVGS